MIIFSDIRGILQLTTVVVLVDCKVMVDAHALFERNQLDALRQRIDRSDHARRPLKIWKMLCKIHSNIIIIIIHCLSSSSPRSWIVLICGLNVTDRPKRALARADSWPPPSAAVVSGAGGARDANVCERPNKLLRLPLDPPFRLLQQTSLKQQMNMQRTMNAIAI